MCVQERDSQGELPVACSVLCPSHPYPGCMLDGFRRDKKWEVILLPRGTAVKNVLQAAALAQTIEAWPHLWADRWCLQEVAVLEPHGIGSSRKCATGVGAVFPALCCRDPMVQPARHSEEGLRSHHQVLIQAGRDTFC